MEKFTTVAARIVPVPISDIDTDMIIPAPFLKSTSREGFGENLFRRLRDDDPSFPLNQDKYGGAEILVGNRNFGCGSSREHAVWAILGAGFKVVIAKSFADIFFNNSAKNGLLLITLPEPVVDQMLSQGQSGQYQVKVDLAAQTAALPDGSVHGFQYDPFRKHCLLNGLDDIDYIFSYRKEIAELRTAQEKNRFFSTLLE